MTPPDEELVGPPDPLAGFDVAVLTDRRVYAAGEAVRITVTATNHETPVIHEYPGWLRFELTVRDATHREVAAVGTDLDPDGGFADRWLPGQMAIWPLYWAQGAGPIVPAWTQQPPGPRVEPGRYRLRVSWLGRPAGSWTRLSDVHSEWFELV